MKKVLTATMIALMVGSSVMAADTYVGTFLEKQEQKLNTAATPLVNKEKQFQAQQKAALELKQKEQIARQKQLDDQKKALEARQKAQQALFDKKKQDLQATKDSLKNEKESIKNTLKQEKRSWKDLFSIE